jgi:hypothetical protein
MYINRWHFFFYYFYIYFAEISRTISLLDLIVIMSFLCWLWFFITIFTMKDLTLLYFDFDFPWVLIGKFKQTLSPCDTGVVVESAIVGMAFLRFFFKKIFMLRLNYLWFVEDFASSDHVQWVVLKELLLI